jgi:hypothetical protein
MKRISKVNILAAQIMKASKAGRSEAMRTAWKLSGQTDIQVVTFRKKDNSITTRVVSKEWTKFQAPRGGDSKSLTNQVIFADLVKYATGETNVIISTFTDKILSLA